MGQRLYRLAQTGWMALLALSALMILPAAAASGPIADLERYFAEVDTLSGQFTQITRDETGAAIETSVGQFVMARSQRFDWHYETPWEQRIVSDGQQLWVYDVDLQQVVVRPLDEALGVGPAQLLSGDMAGLRANFSLSAAREGEAILLTPLDPAWDFQRVRLELEDGVPARIFLRDGLGQTIEVVFEALEFNPSLPAERFEFTPPADVDVLRGS